MTEFSKEKSQIESIVQILTKNVDAETLYKFIKYVDNISIEKLTTAIIENWRSGFITALIAVAKNPKDEEALIKFQARLREVQFNINLIDDADIKHLMELFMDDDYTSIIDYVAKLESLKEEQGTSRK